MMCSFCCIISDRHRNMRNGLPPPNSCGGGSRGSLAAARVKSTAGTTPSPPPPPSSRRRGLDGREWRVLVDVVRRRLCCGLTPEMSGAEFVLGRSFAAALFSSPFSLTSTARGVAAHAHADAAFLHTRQAPAGLSAKWLLSNSKTPSPSATPHAGSEWQLTTMFIGHDSAWLPLSVQSG